MSAREPSYELLAWYDAPALFFLVEGNMSHGESWNWWVTQLQADKELSGREAGQSDEWEVGVGVGRGVAS